MWLKTLDRGYILIYIYIYIHTYIYIYIHIYRNNTLDRCLAYLLFSGSQNGLELVLERGSLRLRPSARRLLHPLLWRCCMRRRMRRKCDCSSVSLKELSVCLSVCLSLLLAPAKWRGLWCQCRRRFFEKGRFHGRGLCVEDYPWPVAR